MLLYELSKIRNLKGFSEELKRSKIPILNSVFLTFKEDKRKTVDSIIVLIDDSKVYKNFTFNLR